MVTQTPHNLNLLFQYACEYQFDAFSGLFHELESGMLAEAFWEAYLIRAQIKLYAADHTILSDLERISRFDGPPQFPHLGSLWQADAPNRFAVFSTTPGAVRGFIDALPDVRRHFSRWYGEPGDITVRQVQSELHYYLCNTRQALDLAEQTHASAQKSATDAFLAECMRFRCYLALGVPQQTEASMLEVISLAKAHPEFLTAYHTFREWANMTTNWNGDMPRFQESPCGGKIPVLEYRLNSIRVGIAQSTPLETPFLQYVVLSDAHAYTLRKYYMDLFHAMYWFQEGDLQQTEAYFRKACQIALDTDFDMAFVEYGEQITPLLQHAKKAGWGSAQWLDTIISRAGEYEKSLSAYNESG
ncbi:hypothetical protein LJC22_03440 [Desulfosarcina sp. OttesenSCG-928-G10]|nr:hypothetical protein [Desulfosarcina sp. OttesenSCG-928-G10]